MARNVLIDHAGRPTGQLSDLDRQIVAWSAGNGLTSAEIGAALGLSGATVRTRLARARRWLRRLTVTDADDDALVTVKVDRV